MFYHNGTYDNGTIMCAAWIVGGPTGKNDKICGTDGKNYEDWFLKCMRKYRQFFGTNINLKRAHLGKCYIWEEYGFQTTTIMLVS